MPLRQRRIAGAPAFIDRDHQRTDARMLASEEIHDGKLLARTGARYRELHKAVAGEARELLGLDQLPGRIAHHGGIELQIARAARIRGARARVAYTLDAEKPDAPTVVRID